MSVKDEVCDSLEGFIRSKAGTPENSLINVFATDVTRILDLRDEKIRDLKSRNGSLVINLEAAADKIVELEKRLQIVTGLLARAKEPVQFAAESSVEDSSDQDLFEEITSYLNEVE